MRKPRVFIASSAESLHIADAINVNLDHQTEPTVWKNGFSLSQNTIDTLINISDSVDFAVFVFTPDDLITIRNQDKHITRDNVIFELGLFTGTLGKERCFIVKPREKELHLPSDLLGLTPADYNGDRSDGNIEAAINNPCTLIKNEINKLGLRSENVPSPQLKKRNKNTQITIGKIEEEVLKELIKGHICTPDGVLSQDLFNNIKGIQNSDISLSIIKLERSGLIDRSISSDGHYDYYTFRITESGIDYAIEIPSSPEKPAPKPSITPNYDSFDDDIPF